MSSVDEERTARLAAIRERVAAATPGPWETLGSSIEQVGGEYETVVGLEERGSAYMRYEVLAVKPTDAEFIAHSRDDIEFLLAALESVSPRLVTSEAEADELGQDSLILEPGGMPLRKRVTESDDGYEHWWYPINHKYWGMKSGPLFQDFTGPFTVLWSPAPEGKN